MSGDARKAIAIAAAIWITLLALTPLTTLWDRDEPRFAQAAVEMLARGDYLVPTFNGDARVQKPPLVYWLMTLSIRAFGPTELAVRFWSPLALAVTALATFAIGRRLWSARAGHAAMIVVAVTPLSLVEGVAATADAVLLAALTCAIAAGLRVVTVGPRLIGVAALAAALGVALLTKGPVGFVVPIVVLAAVAWADRAEGRGRRFGALGLGGGVAVAAFLAWLVPASAASGGAAVDRGLVRENVGRFMTTMEGHGTPPAVAALFYPAVVLIGFLPWSLYGWAVWRERWRLSQAPLGPPLLAAWVAAPLVLFTLAATKLPHYILPIWPALALTVAVARDDALRAGGAWAHLLRRGAVTAVALVALTAAVAPRIERAKPVPPLAAAVRASAIEGPLAVYGFEEPSLRFYARRPMVVLASAGALVTWAHAAPPALLVTTRAAIDDVQAAAGPLPLTELASRAGWNYVNGRAIELVAFARASGR